jgi:phage tail sheath protein FI
VDSVQDILNWHNGTLVRTSAFNSSYGTLMWAWQKVYDEYNVRDVWTAPSGHVASEMAYTDTVAYPWFAPAGFKRGLLKSSDVRYSPDQGERDSMQNGTQCVNPIVNFVGVGIAVFGQKTLLRSNSALNRVNVRRMLLQVETVIAGACRYLTFDPNDDALFRELEQITEPTLSQVLTQRGIREYKLVNATTDADRENVTLRGRIFIKPMKAAEIIVLEYVLTSQGANFEELIAA